MENYSRNNKITCPHCQDVWQYKMVIEHGNNKSLVTDDFHILEDNQICTCFKCHGQYTLKITTPPSISVDDFIYQAWKHCKM